MIQSQERGATIYAEFLGGSFTCDAYHMTEPHPEGKEMFETIINTFFVMDAVKFLFNVVSRSPVKCPWKNGCLNKIKIN